jgi:hypothetical protein
MPSQLDHRIVAVAERGGQLTVGIRFVLPVGLSEQVAELIGLALRQFHGGAEGAVFRRRMGVAEVDQSLNSPTTWALRAEFPISSEILKVTLQAGRLFKNCLRIPIFFLSSRLTAGLCPENNS